MDSYRNWIITELEIWKNTFNNQYPETMEKAIEDDKKAYEELDDLIIKFSKSDCHKVDYENILFHLWQKKSE